MKLPWRHHAGGGGVTLCRNTLSPLLRCVSQSRITPVVAHDRLYSHFDGKFNSDMRGKGVSLRARVTWSTRKQYFWLQRWDSVADRISSCGLKQIRLVSHSTSVRNASVAFKRRLGILNIRFRNIINIIFGVCGYIRSADFSAHTTSAPLEKCVLHSFGGL